MKTLIITLGIMLIASMAWADDCTNFQLPSGENYTCCTDYNGHVNCWGG